MRATTRPGPLRRSATPVRMEAGGAGKAGAMPAFQMRYCDMCGQECRTYFEVSIGSDPRVTYTFDCFECAIQRLAPVCDRCRCRVLGHGVEVGLRSGATIFCCAPCGSEVEGQVRRPAGGRLWDEARGVGRDQG